MSALQNAMSRTEGNGMFREYPKMLYRGDDAKIVDCRMNEDCAKQDGWREYGEEDKPRRGRPPGSVNKPKEE